MLSKGLRGSGKNSIYLLRGTNLLVGFVLKSMRVAWLLEALICIVSSTQNKLIHDGFLYISAHRQESLAGSQLGTYSVFGVHVVAPEFALSRRLVGA